MNKVLTLATLASLSLATEDIQDNNLSFLQTLMKDVKKAGPFLVSGRQPETIAAVFLADDELFNAHLLEADVKKAGKFLIEHPELVKEAEQKAKHIIRRYSGHKELLKQDAKKALEYVTQHPEAFIQVAELFKNLHQKKAEAADHELLNLGGLINDGLNIYKDVKTHNYGGLVNHGVQTVKDIKKHDDEEFFKVADDIKKVRQDIKDGIHRLEEGADIAQHLINDEVHNIFNGSKKISAHDDEELFSIQQVKQDLKDDIHRFKQGVGIAKHLINDQAHGMIGGGKKDTNQNDDELFSRLDNMERARKDAEIAKRSVKLLHSN